MAIITTQTMELIADELEAQNAILGAIAGDEAGSHPVHSWQDVAEIVESGIAPFVFKYWEQFALTIDGYGDTFLDIVDFNNHSQTENDNMNSMTLLMHHAINNKQFQAKQAFIVATNGLTAGTYNFKIATAREKWTVGNYQFTLPINIPNGSQMVVSGNYSTALAGQNLLVYASPNDTAVLTTIPITSGNGGTYIGEAESAVATNGCYISHPACASYGNNCPYEDSAIDQWLNAEGNGWWKPQTIFDRPPSYVSEAGFLSKIPQDFKDAVGETCVKCATNNTYVLPTSKHRMGEAFNIQRKFFLPSRNEIFGGDTSDGSHQLGAYVGLSNADRIKYDIASQTTARNWWVRTPYPTHANGVYIVYTSGAITAITAVYGYAVAVACSIYHRKSDALASAE